MNSIKPNKTKIRYVALGDSITEGYNAFLSFGYSGSFDKKSKIVTGTSWPSFLVRFIQKMDFDLIENFINFGLSGSRIEDWNYFLSTDTTKYTYESSKNKINFFHKLNNATNNPEKDRLEKLFKKFGQKNLKDFDFLIKSIKEANLITINIGANSIIPNIPIVDISKWVMDKNFLASDISNKVKEVIWNSKNELIILLKRIKQLNNKAAINLIGYILPFNPLFRSISFFLKQGFELDKRGIIPFITKQLNLMLAEAALEVGINFIDVNNESYWEQENSTLSKTFYDIHPTTKGYKRMAQDVLAKLALSNKFLKKSNEKILKKIKTYDIDFVIRSKNQFKNSINFSRLNWSDKKIIKFLFGNNNYLFKEDDGEEKFVKEIVKPFNFEQSFDDSIDPNKTLMNSIKNFIGIVFSSIDVETSKKDSNLIWKNLDNNQFAIFLNNSSIISFVLNNIQNSLFIYYKTNSNIEPIDFVNLIAKTLFDEKNFIYIINEIQKYLYSIKTKNEYELTRKFITNLFVFCFKNNDIKNNIYMIIKNVINEKINDSCINISEITKKEILKTLFDDLNFEVIIKNVFKHYFDVSKNLIQVNSYKDFIKILINKKFENFDVSKIVQLISSNNEIKVDLIKLFLNKIKIDHTESNIQIVEDFLNLLINNIEDWRFVNYLSFEIIKGIILGPDKNKNNLRIVIDLLMDLDKVEFWDKLKSQKILNFIESDQFINSFSLFTDLLWNNFDNNKEIYSLLKNLPISETIKSITNKPIQLKIVKLIWKLLQSIKPFTTLINSLYKSFINTNNENEIYYENIYYKTIYRLIVLLHLIFYKSFQQKIKNNIFYPNGKLFTNNIIFIVNIVFKFCINNEQNNINKINFFIKLFGENPKNLNNKITENTYLSNQWLWYIYSSDENPIDRFTNKLKIDLILISLKKGYWNN